jgi:hypothetical protein
MLFLVLSAFHKEIRRSDVNRALHYGDLIVRNFSARHVLNYVRRIFLEEARDLSTFLALDRKDWRNCVVQICQVRKKYEREFSYSQVVKKAKAYLSAFRNPAPPKHGEELLKHKDFYTALADLFRLRMNIKKPHRRKFAKQLCDNLSERALSARLITGENYNLSFYQWIVVLEDFYSLHSLSTSNSSVQSISLPDSERVLFPQNYVFDIHTTQGKGLIIKHWQNILPGKPLPGGLDLRFSGATSSYLWREHAFHQLGEAYRTARWEDITISSHDFKLARKFDSFFYRTLYQQVEPALLAWTGDDLTT